MPARISHRSIEEYSQSDPFDRVWAPPANESLSEKEARMTHEAEAKRISDAIDQDIDKQRTAEKKAGKPVKVLLLGQSESGKSTTLKNFQLMYDTKAFRQERASWRAIIQLNVVRSVHIILDAITQAYSNQNTFQDPSSSVSSIPRSTPDLPYIEEDLIRLKYRLQPLLRAEEVLTRRLTVRGETEPTKFDTRPHRSPTSSRNDSDPTVYDYSHATHVEHRRTQSASGAMPGGTQREPVVYSTTPWKDMFGRFRNTGGVRQSYDSQNPVDWDDPNDPGRVLYECRQDIKDLWEHRVVQELLEKQNLRLEEMAGFFLDCIDEVTMEKYLPTDDHILRARLKTLGVSEHRVRMSADTTGNSIGRDWRIFDVGGHRTLRSAWAPYFDDVDAIIFLAPISAFDQVLAEAPKVNRLEDSVVIWTSICSNKLLKDTNIILFLNKCDIMKQKLGDGIRLKDYVVSYGERKNDFETASNYLRKKFAGILKENSPVPRVFYCHLTSVIDTRSTKKVIANVKDMLMRENLKSSTLIL